MMGRIRNSCPRLAAGVRQDCSHGGEVPTFHGR